MRYSAEFEKELNQLYRVFSKNEAGFAAVVARLQKNYPGAYTIRECYRPDYGNWGAELVFEDKDEELMFALRWS